MKENLILANLLHRPVRTLVSVLAVAIEVTLILVVVGLTTGISTETGKRIEGVGADIMFQPPNSSVFLAFNASPMPVTLAGKIAEVEGVKAVSPVLTQVSSQGGLDIVYGIDLPTFNAVSSGFVFHEGREFQAPDEIIVDDWYARAKRLRAGDEHQLLNQTFKVVGIVEHGKGARVFIPLKTAQELVGSVDKASLFFVKCDSPELTSAVIARLDELLPGYPARPLREFVSMMSSSNLPALDAFIQTVVFVAVIIGVLVIFLSMYTTITERTREIGILRSLGATKPFIVAMILRESIAICVVGILAGLGMSFLGARLVQQVFPTLVVMITGEWIVKATLYALLSGVFGALYPSLKAAGQDPVEALAYE